MNLTKFKVPSRSAMEDRVNIPMLSPDNYQRWKFDISAILEYKELLDIVQGSAVKPEGVAALKIWKKGDARAKMIISSGLDEETHATIRNCKTSADVWTGVKGR